MKEHAIIDRQFSSRDFDPKTSTGWFWTGDNLSVMSGLDSNIIDLIYLDPPFNSKKEWINVFKTADKSIELKFNDIWKPKVKDVHELQLIRDTHSSVADFIDTVGEIAGERMRSYLIFMASRLQEMKRILKEDKWSIYLHCDPTASHFLKGVMDGIFGNDNFRNEIIWRIGWVSGFKTQRKGWIRNHDVILYYASPEATKSFNKEYISYVDSYKRRDGKLPTGKGIPIEDTWNCSEGDKLNSIAIESFSTEKVGYPTQKPLALLERIIKASSNEGDLIFDPFAGCVTTLVAADRLNRRWIGCDISEVAVPILRKRIKDDYPSHGPQLTDSQGLGFITDVITPEDLPSRSNSQQVKHSLKLRTKFAIQELNSPMYTCPGCGEILKLRYFHLDHLIPVSRGGSDSEKNRILLCGPCNLAKSAKTWEEWSGKPFLQ